MSQPPVPRPEYPRPQLVREMGWLNLNGVWEFEVDHGRSGAARGLPTAERLGGTIQVPFAPESPLSGAWCRDFMQAVWYRRRLEIPPEWEGRRVLLHVGACDYHSSVYLDGRRIGGHVGGYTPFTLDLTPHLQGREAVLTLAAEDDVRSGAQAKGKQSHVYDSVGWDYTRTTGIWQTVWLEAVPQTWLKGLRLTPQLAAGGVSVTAALEGEILPAGARLRLRALAEGRAVGSADVPFSGRTAIAFLEVSEVRPWGPDDPFLYDLHVTVEDAHGRLLDEVRSYFGLRSIALNGFGLELNGKVLFQRLVLDQGFYPDGIYTAPTDEHLRRDIELAQAMGFNGARLHQKVFEPRFLYWADRLGYLVWGEAPDWGLDVGKADGLAAFMHNWVEQLERDFSHPSLVGWMPFNEHDSRSNPEAFRAVYRMTKACDPTRPVIDTSGWMHVETDIYDVHDYTQDPEAFAARYRPLLTGEGEIYRCLDLDVVHGTNCDYRPGQPYFVSEYGGIWWNPAKGEGWGYGRAPATAEEFLERYRGLTEVLLAHPKMCGFCYTQLTDVEQEVNGLYTFDRVPKFDPEVLRAINAQPAAIELEAIRTRPAPAPPAGCGS